jgi:hypothetical protein
MENIKKARPAALRPEETRRAGGRAALFGSGLLVVFGGDGGTREELASVICSVQNPFSDNPY